MKILSAEEIRNWDQYTIEHEPISSLDLMERAASRVTDWVLDHYPDHSYVIFCGKGNNGGDGLAVGRMLLDALGDKAGITVYILEFGAKGTDDFQTNLSKLHHYPGADIHFVQDPGNLHPVNKDALVIDALFGSGLNRGIEGLTSQVVEHMNQSGRPIVSIDIPSGLFTDHSAKGMLTVKASHTLSFQCYKPAFLFAENEEAIGELHILDIGLAPAYLDTIHPRFEFISKELLANIYRPRKKFSHKGNFGHALLLAGSYGKMGAAVLAARACLRSGTGLLTLHIPRCGYDILQGKVPEAMVISDQYENVISKLAETNLGNYDSVGIGPGIGTAGETRSLLKEVLDHYRKPMVLDADALNIFSVDKEFLNLIPPGSILTPHPKEFERLFGASINDMERAELAMAKAKELNCHILIKGHFSFVALPGGGGLFNSTGNPGMATGGSGDVLTGILTGLLTQGYAPKEALILGVYLHGLAGDIAAEKYSMEAMIASDIVENLGEAFNSR